MKVDLDSILYIIITIVVLVISGLGSRRKKKLQQTQVPGSARSGYPDSDSDMFETIENEEEDEDYAREATSRPVMTTSSSKAKSPLERLEQFITGQMPEAVSMEGESMEETRDEEEVIMEEIRKSREEASQPEQEEEKIEPVLLERQIPKSALNLFGNVDEIKKAIIYSEVFKRKYT